MEIIAFLHTSLIIMGVEARKDPVNKFFIRWTLKAYSFAVMTNLTEKHRFIIKYLQKRFK